VNLQVVDDAEPTEKGQCLSKLSDSEFDKSMQDFIQRLEKIEQENSLILSKNLMKLVPNLQQDWLTHLRSNLDQAAGHPSTGVLAS